MTDLFSLEYKVIRRALLTRSSLTMVATLLAIGLLAPTVQAQEKSQPEPERLEGVTWNTVYLYDFESSKEGRAMEILGKHLIPSYSEAGIKAPRVVELQTGPWDVMLVAEMQEGPSSMTWKVPPEAIEIQQVLQQKLGSEKAGKIRREYGSAIARSTSFVGYSGRRGPPITGKVPE